MTSFNHALQETIDIIHAADETTYSIDAVSLMYTLYNQTYTGSPYLAYHRNDVSPDIEAYRFDEPRYPWTFDALVGECENFLVNMEDVWDEYEPMVDAETLAEYLYCRGLDLETIDVEQLNAIVLRGELV